MLCFKLVNTFKKVSSDLLNTSVSGIKLSVFPKRNVLLFKEQEERLPQQICFLFKGIIYCLQNNTSQVTELNPATAIPLDYKDVAP